jgi:hypothetical protein
MKKVDNAETVANPLPIRAPLLPVPMLIVGQMPQITRPSKIHGLLSSDAVTCELPVSAGYFPYSRHFTSIPSVRLGKRQAIEQHPAVRHGKLQAVEELPVKKRAAAAGNSARPEQQDDRSRRTDDAKGGATAAAESDALMTHCVDPSGKRIVWSGKIAVNGIDICDAEITSCIPVDTQLWNMLVYHHGLLMTNFFFDVLYI